MKKTQSGSSLLHVLLIIVVITAVSLGGYHIYSSKKQSGSSNNQTGKLALLSGVVTVGPTTPVCSNSQSCNSAVADHTIQALDANGRVAATSKTDTEGKYSLNLEPGSYSLVLIPTIGVIKDNHVEVKNGSNQFNLLIDTGIR